MVNPFLTDVFYLFQPSFGLALLTIPFIFLQYGVQISIEIITLYTLLELGSIILQIQLSQYLPKKSAAFSVLLHQINPHWVTVFDLVVGIRTLSISIMSLCLLSTLSQNLIINILNWNFISWLDFRPFYIFILTFFVLLPISLTKRVNLIKYSTQITFTFLSSIILSLPLNMISQPTNNHNSVTNNDGNKQNIFSKTYLSSIILFTLSSHRSIFPVLNESYATCKYTLKIFSCYIILTSTICLIYGYFGSIFYCNYLSDGSNIPSDCFTILFSGNNNYKFLTILLTFSLICAALLSFPLSLCPLRAALYHLLDTFYNVQDDLTRSITDTSSSSNSTGNTTITTPNVLTYYKTDATLHDTNSDINETTPLITLEGRRVSIDEMIEEGYTDWLRSSVQNTMRDPRFNSLTTLVLIVSFIVSSFFIKSLIEMSIFLGCTTSVAYTFILPGIMGRYYFGTNHWKSSHEEDTVIAKRRRNLICSIIYITTGVVMSVVCIIGTLKMQPWIESYFTKELL